MKLRNVNFRTNTYILLHKQHKPQICCGNVSQFALQTFFRSTASQKLCLLVVPAVSNFLWMNTSSLVWKKGMREIPNSWLSIKLSFLRRINWFTSLADTWSLVKWLKIQLFELSRHAFSSLFLEYVFTRDCLPWSILNVPTDWEVLNRKHHTKSCSLKAVRI